ncbi:hypothetical protein QYE76_048469 [Lolium multiflorum]|uniref:CCHC-type domain-containing protein n=1 Tax=Lolium multiflorum TaxID=4521 RepID=A0AAD8WHD1_LOLMU|nr:hypothetical protein QYE76_048466 [Lolium multiflorum]KAK1660310.1 hypothetical protein QYE76_048469 [Lolium multiflorum]
MVKAGETSAPVVETVGPALYPRLDRKDYGLWALNMEVAMEAEEIWEAIDPGGDDYVKGGAKYTKDRKALTAIYSVVPKDVMQHLVGKKSAKDAWETIKTLHQGHARVREAHLQTLTKSYEDLKMEESETVDQFAARFVTLINAIRGYGEKLDEVKNVRRFLRAAPARHMQIVTSIEQCLDLNTLTVEDLVGRFKAHDERIRLSFDDPEQSEHLMLTKQQWMTLSKEKQGGSTSRSNGKEKQRPAKKYIAEQEEDDEAPPRRKFDIKKVRCHNCGKLGHFKADCQKASKDRALLAQEEDDGPMMLMLEVCEQEDTEELTPPAQAPEMVDHMDQQRSAPFPCEEASELVHGDLCVEISPATPSGNKYFMLVVDDYSQYMWIVLLKSKDQALQEFMKIKEAGEFKAQVKIKVLCIDQEGELHQTVVAMARSMMKSKGLPGKFWGEAVNTAVYLLNRAPSRSVAGITPYEAWYGWKPSVDHLRTFGCVAHVKTVSGHNSKLVNRSTPMIMTGYDGSKTYRLCNPYTNKVVVTSDVVFEEENSWNWSSNETNSVSLVSSFIVAHAGKYTVCRASSNNAKDKIVPISIFWQVPQYFIIGAAEVFTFVGQLEFFYDQAPDAMRSMCSALSLTTVALGSYLSTLLVTVVAKITTRGGKEGWIPDNLNVGHLDYFFWLLAGLSLANFAVYLLIASWYTYKKTAEYPPPDAVKGSAAAEDQYPRAVKGSSAVHDE